ncbi:hypothetical protein [Crateriforma spongiae]|uniref:hypothetical protein n=1 Tax=Crateriforma spongiae TaxID=2724528 RepID=UPI0039B0EF72
MNSQFSTGFGIALVLGITVGALWPKFGPTIDLQDAQAVGLVSTQSDHHGAGSGHQGCGSGGRSDHGGCGGHGQKSSSGGCDGQCEDSQASGSSLASHRGHAGQGRGQGGLKTGQGSGQARQGRGRRQADTFVSRGNARQGHGRAGNRTRHEGNAIAETHQEHSGGRCSGGSSCSGDAAQPSTSQHGHAAGGCSGESGDHGACGVQGEHEAKDDIVDSHERGHGPGLGLGMGLGRGWGREFARIDAETQSEESAVNPEIVD